MKISKTQFLNLISFDFLTELKQGKQQLMQSVSLIKANLELDSLIDLEDKEFAKDMFKNMHDNNGDDLLSTEDLHLEMMLPYYNELEIISGKAIENKFGGNIIYSLQTYQQKRFNFVKNEVDFYCFLDGYQEDDDTIRIFETKATTSSKFSLKNNNFFFSSQSEKGKQKHEFFIKQNNDIYYPYDNINVPYNSDYYEKEAKLFNKYDDRGHYIYDLLYQKYVIENSIKTNKKIEYYLVTLDHEYIHDGKVNERGEPIYSDDVVRFYNLTSLLSKMMPLIEEDIKTFIKIINNDNELNQYLFNNIDISKIPDENSILVYTNRHHGFKDVNNNKYEITDLLKSGYNHALDVPMEWLNRKNNQIQREVIKSNKPYYNKEKIKAAIKELKYPIYHLDFESFNCPLPRFKDESPYTQSLFQYSIHIERSPGVCDKDKDNYYYLANNHNDYRLELLKSMLEVIKPDGGSILVYNIGFEKARLKELQKYFPNYYHQIEDLISRLFDLQHIVKGNKKLYIDLGFSEDVAGEYNFYHTDLQGSYSIKRVLPVFSNLKYSNLEVQNGIEAMVVYHRLPNLNKNEFKQQYQALIEYCKQDTWAMFEILNKLREI